MDSISTGNKSGQIKRLGVFKSILSRIRPDNILTISRKGQLDVKSLVLSYLRSGCRIVYVPGVEKDLLAVEKKVIMGPHVRTDGVWAWTDDLTFYVDNYDLDLPSDFVHHCELSQWRVQENLPRIDFDQLE